MFEVGVARSFHALHQLEEEAESALHAGEHEHDYRVEAIARGERLDDGGMLLDLDLLGEALSACLEELDASDLDALPAFAGRTTTVEVVADHVWQHVRERIGGVDAVQSLRVTVFESAVAWASVERPLEEADGGAA